MQDDLISRSAVLGLFAQNADAVRPYSKTWEEVKALPPVNPQPKIGHWIPLGNYDDFGNESSYKCSECGDLDAYPDDFCPDCGAKMVELQESEVKEC